MRGMQGLGDLKIEWSYRRDIGRGWVMIIIASCILNMYWPMPLKAELSYNTLLPSSSIPSFSRRRESFSRKFAHSTPGTLSFPIHSIGLHHVVR